MTTLDSGPAGEGSGEGVGEGSEETVGISGAIMAGTAEVKPDNKDGIIKADSEPGNWLKEAGGKTRSLKQTRFG